MLEIHSFVANIDYLTILDRRNVRIPFIYPFIWRIFIYEMMNEDSSNENFRCDNKSLENP